MQNTVHNLDCMLFLKAQSDKAFDLAIVDPPYGINICKQGAEPWGGGLRSRHFGGSKNQKKKTTRNTVTFGFWGVLRADNLQKF